MQTFFKELTQGGGKTWVMQLKEGKSTACTPNLGENFDFVQHHHQKAYSDNPGYYTYTN